jgi:hypothetical protein
MLNGFFQYFGLRMCCIGVWRSSFMRRSLVVLNLAHQGVTIAKFESTGSPQRPTNRRRGRTLSHG